MVEKVRESERGEGSKRVVHSEGIGNAGGSNKGESVGGFASGVSEGKHKVESKPKNFRAPTDKCTGSYQVISNLELGPNVALLLAWGELGNLGDGSLTDAPWPLSRPVRNSLIFKNREYRCRGIQTNCEIDSGVRQQERCRHRACNQLKIPSIKLGSFSLGIEIFWLVNGCENIGVAMVEYR
ncbi:hypothetical protein PIB30_067243 [Stylosanthes scabra]|uniref:Uncharacterized protein n=1 Tax=Stylosanthes scabra TaxID=79078 RepID=A0ABU6ZLA2_9FABA|nr:hypothetical protein [Stylosanthes scabra]